MFLCSFHFSVHHGLVKITNKLLTTKSNGYFSGLFINDIFVAFGTAGAHLLISALYTFISFEFWHNLSAFKGASSFASSLWNMDT